MTFKTSTTIEEQVDYIKKYGLIIQFKKLTVFQCVALIALLINFICCLLYHFYFFCAYDILKLCHNMIPAIMFLFSF